MDEASEEGGFADAGGTEDDDFSFEGLRGRWRHFVVVVVFCGVVVLWPCVVPRRRRSSSSSSKGKGKGKEKERKEKRKQSKTVVIERRAAVGSDGGDIINYCTALLYCK